MGHEWSAWTDMEIERAIRSGVMRKVAHHASGLARGPIGIRRLGDTKVEHLGRLVLRNLRTIGTIQLLANDKVRSGHIEAENVDIASADARGYTERPKGYGVEVIPGAFVLWDQQADRGVTITADLKGLDCQMRRGLPCRGLGRDSETS